MNDSSEAPSCHSAARASDPFLIGTAISGEALPTGHDIHSRCHMTSNSHAAVVYQNSGCPGTNWDTFEQKERGKGKTTIQASSTSKAL